MMGDNISRTLLLHLPQQLHPIQSRSVLKNSHAQACRPKVEQVEFWVQLQHFSNFSQAQQMDGQLTVELVPLTTLGFSSLIFRPPDEPAAVR